MIAQIEAKTCNTTIQIPLAESPSVAALAIPNIRAMIQSTSSTMSMKSHTISSMPITIKNIQ